jgi:tRNA pseudouridine55 synthase
MPAPETDGSEADGPATDGLVLVDKPSGMTSHDVVARMRRIAHTRKVGHAGTLDPMATGVLVLGINRGTRLLHHLVLTDKAYTATLRLGMATVTDDAEGEPLQSTSAAAVREDDVRAALARFTGAIEQVPSSVSAIKVDGRRAYARVRAGEAVDLPARPVTVHRFDAIAFSRPGPELLDVEVQVECSSGTYVRALARDVGDALGVGGHLTALRRTRVGPFLVDDAVALERLAEPGALAVLGLTAAISQSMPVRTIDAAQQRELGFGRSLAAVDIDGVYGAIGGDGTAVALLRESDGRAAPVLVFTPAG